MPCPGHVAHKLTNRWNQIEAVQHVKGANRQTEDKYHIQAGSAYVSYETDKSKAWLS